MPVPGGVYYWQLLNGQHPVEGGSFKVASADQEKEINEALDEITDGSYPAMSTAILQGAALANGGFSSEARGILLQAVDRNWEEAAPYLLLRRVYTGLGFREMYSSRCLDYSDPPDSPGVIQKP